MAKNKRKDGSKKASKKSVHFKGGEGDSKEFESDGGYSSESTDEDLVSPKEKQFLLKYRRKMSKNTLNINQMHHIIINSKDDFINNYEMDMDNTSKILDPTILGTDEMVRFFLSFFASEKK